MSSKKNADKAGEPKRIIMTYRQTVLDMMMKYPTIFPSQRSVDIHMFLGYGTGLEWGEDGSLYDPFTSHRKEAVERSRESIIGEHKERDPYCNHCRFEKGEDCCFYHAGNDLPLLTHDISESFSPICLVADGRVKPNKDWGDAIEAFCYDVLRQDKKAIKYLLKANSRVNYSARHKDWFQRDWGNFKSLRKICSTVIENRRQEIKKQVIRDHWNRIWSARDVGSDKPEDIHARVSKDLKYTIEEVVEVMEENQNENEL